MSHVQLSNPSVSPDFIQISDDSAAYGQPALELSVCGGGGSDQPDVMKTFTNSLHFFLHSFHEFTDFCRKILYRILM